jgi:hypothetical protein
VLPGLKNLHGFAESAQSIRIKVREYERSNVLL